MEKTTLQTVADYVVTLESRLGLESGNPHGWNRELTKVRVTIEQLENASFKSQDCCERAFLRSLHDKAQKCQRFIIGKIGAVAYK